MKFIISINLSYFVNIIKMNISRIDILIVDSLYMKKSIDLN